MRIPVLKTVGWILALVVVAALPVVMAGQAAPSGTGPGATPPRWDIFMGYSFLAPFGTVNTVKPDAALTPVSVSYDPVTRGRSLQC